MRHIPILLLAAIGCSEYEPHPPLPPPDLEITVKKIQIERVLVLADGKIAAVKSDDNNRLVLVELSRGTEIIPDVPADQKPYILETTTVDKAIDRNYLVRENPGDAHVPKYKARMRSTIKLEIHVRGPDDLCSR